MQRELNKNKNLDKRDNYCYLTKLPAKEIDPPKKEHSPFRYNNTAHPSFVRRNENGE